MTKIDEAFGVLGLSKTASEDELKTKYKELAKKYHPDVYKDDPEKFKKINEAYQLIQDYKTNPSKYEPRPFSRNDGGFQNINLSDLFSHFHTTFTEDDDPSMQSHKTVNIPPPNISLKITFKESILGEDRPVKYNKWIKCVTCNGVGLEYISNGCQSCNGFGRIVSNNKGMVFSKVCTKCYGKNIKKNKCKICDVKGIIENLVEGSVHVPAGVVDGMVLRLAGAGHYMGNSLFGDSYGDVFVHVNVEKDPDLQLIGTDVVTHLKISLLDALTGCSREVRTIHGNKHITIPSCAKNKDELRLTGCGVKGTSGVQRVILDIDYPTNTKALIEHLKNSQN
jgi:molecular chaperone DnaJ